MGHVEREGHFTPFRLIDFLMWLGHIGVEHTERRTNDINGLVERMVKENLLLQAGSDGSLWGQRYVGGASLTWRQAGADLSASLWTAPVLGPALLIHEFTPSVAHITGDKDGVVRNGSGILIDDRHVLTAAHVVTDMTLNDCVHLDGGIEAAVIGAHPHDDVDVAVLEVDVPEEGLEKRTRGMAFRDPRWADRVTVLGYPPVPQTVAAYLTVLTGEVVNPQVISYVARSEHFLFSATARPGNSGGPIIGADGRVLGLVTRDFFADNGDENSTGHVMPFPAGITTSAIQRALSEMASYEKILPIETWTAHPPTPDV